MPVFSCVQWYSDSPPVVVVVRVKRVHVSPVFQPSAWTLKDNRRVSYHLSLSPSWDSLVSSLCSFQSQPGSLLEQQPTWPTRLDWAAQSWRIKPPIPFLFACPLLFWGLFSFCFFVLCVGFISVILNLRTLHNTELDRMICINPPCNSSPFLLNQIFSSELLPSHIHYSISTDCIPPVGAILLWTWATGVIWVSWWSCHAGTIWVDICMSLPPGLDGLCEVAFTLCMKTLNLFIPVQRMVMNPLDHNFYLFSLLSTIFSPTH